MSRFSHVTKAKLVEAYEKQERELAAVREQRDRMKGELARINAPDAAGDGLVARAEKYRQAAEFFKLSYERLSTQHEDLLKRTADASEVKRERDQWQTKSGRLSGLLIDLLFDPKAAASEVAGRITQQFGLTDEDWTDE